MEELSCWKHTCTVTGSLSITRCKNNNYLSTYPFLLADHLCDPRLDFHIIGGGRRRRRRWRWRQRERQHGVGCGYRRRDDGCRRQRGVGRWSGHQLQGFGSILGRTGRLEGGAATLLHWTLRGHGYGFFQPRFRFQIVFAVDVGQSSYLEGFRHFQQRTDLLLRNVDLPFVHELDDGFHLRPLDVLQYDYRMLARIVEEERLEVRTASREHHLVRFDGVTVARQCDVDERFTLQELIEDVGQIGLVVVPSETELLRRAGTSPGSVVMHHRRPGTRSNCVSQRGVHGTQVVASESTALMVPRSVPAKHEDLPSTRRRKGRLSSAR